MRVLDLFSGIGGFHLGLERAGFKVESYFSEIDKYAIDVYSNNFKNATYVGSVTDVRGADLPRIDAITFGSPCQDFSLAGKRKGLGGDRSSLIGEAIRLISEWQLLNTKWFLPQNRERIYLVGYLGDGSRGQVFPISEVAESFIEQGRGNRFIDVYNKKYRDECPTLTDPKHNSVRVQVKIGDYRNDEGYREREDGNSPTLNARARQDIFGQPIVNKIRRLTPIECERLQGFPDNWTKYGTKGEISDSQRYKMCGNAVTVNVVQAVAERIKLVIE
jgi:DNA (cytosine-5)-methyltransferase 1